ncbi:AbrB family looped-hinge helix DNA binding protein [Stackebrandtia albiflava]|uniref:AbrB family looped-hinge helix DNA binding protein n=1 Tax=Stackebrandtia albiflava TaxID=406432 RepID=A0A562UQQ0_9ACTN|nr:AbrB family looped-hinge helix DNA binding protein [Stackebrandtia albiflava]
MTRVSAKHQVTLPAVAMRAAGIKVGDELLVRVESDGRLVLVREASRLDAWSGALPGLGTADDVEMLRDEWER